MKRIIYHYLWNMILDKNPLSKISMVIILFIMNLISINSVHVMEDVKKSNVLNVDKLRFFFWAIQLKYKFFPEILKDKGFNFSKMFNLDSLDIILNYLQKNYQSLQNTRDIKKGLINDCYQLIILAQKHRIHYQNNELLMAKESKNKFFDKSNSILRDLFYIENTIHSDKIKKQSPLYDETKKIEALKDVSDIFSELGHHNWFIISGSFLGLIREGKFLPHDSDIDIGFYASEIEYSTVINNLLNSNNFIVKLFENQYHLDSSNKELDEPAFIKVVHHTGISVDFFLHHYCLRSNQRNVWHGSYLHRWYNNPFDLTEYSMGSLKVLGPTDADLYLSENYGCWREPLVDFNFLSHTPNLELVRNLHCVAMYLSRLVQSAVDGSPEYWEIIQFLKSQNLIDQASMDVPAKLTLDKFLKPH